MHTLRTTSIWFIYIYINTSRKNCEVILLFVYMYLYLITYTLFIQLSRRSLNPDPKPIWIQKMSYFINQIVKLNFMSHKALFVMQYTHFQTMDRTSWTYGTGQSTRVSRKGWAPSFNHYFCDGKAGLRIRVQIHRIRIRTARKKN